MHPQTGANDTSRFFRFLPIATVLLLASLATPVRAASHDIAVPQAVTGDQVRLIHAAVTDFVMGTRLGDTILVIDATANETIAVFTTPADSRADVPNLRRRALAEPLNAFKRFMRGHCIDAPLDDPDQCRRGPTAPTARPQYPVQGPATVGGASERAGPGGRGEA